MRGGKRLRHVFDWDPTKETGNIRKHSVSFRRAATVFQDANQLSVYDKEHSDVEDRWITLGIDSEGVLRVVVHTFDQVGQDSATIRIISARKATRREIEQYRKRER
jgi:uncharacterized protein